MMGLADEIMKIIDEARRMSVLDVRGNPERAFVVINFLCDEIEKFEKFEMHVGDFVRCLRHPKGAPGDREGDIGRVESIDNVIVLVRFDIADRLWVKKKDLRIVRKADEDEERCVCGHAKSKHLFNSIVPPCMECDCGNDNIGYTKDTSAEKRRE